MVWTTIPDSDIDPDSPVTTGLMTAYRDNFPALAQGLTGAPKIQTAALEQTASSEAVTQACMRAAAVGQNELKSTTGIISWTTTTPGGTNTQTLPGGEYGFTKQTRVSNATYFYGDFHGYENSSGSLIGLYNNTSYIAYHTFINDYSNPAVSHTLYAQQRYMQASRPYDMGDGEILRFIFALIDNATGNVEAVYNATEAPWHYNGKTDIRGKLFPNGKKYRQRRDVSSFGMTMAQAKAAGKSQFLDYMQAFNESPIIWEEITQDIKNADMVDLPHPFLENNLTGKTVVLLDPVSPIVQQLDEFCQHDEFDLNSLLHDGYFKIGNTDIGRVSPAGVLVPSFNWKLTA